MQTVVELPPRADPGIVSPRKTPGAFFRIWLTVVQRQLHQTHLRGKHCLASCARGPRPGPASSYTMLVASDIRQDACGMEL